MKWLHTIVREVFGLFVEDGGFAITILAWVVVLTLSLPPLGWIPQWRGLIFFCGLALILAGSALRYTRSK